MITATTKQSKLFFWRFQLVLGGCCALGAKPSLALWLVPSTAPRVEPCETPSSPCFFAVVIVDFLLRNDSMADPLSIAASVAGLLSVAVKVGTIITNFISSVNDAPESARAVLTTVEGMRLTLTSVKHLIDGLSKLPKERKEMIHVKHLVVIFRETILSFSDLEAIIVPPAGSQAEATGWDTVKWLWREKDISRAVQRLESHRASLSLMLNVLQW